jgi:hypothetical protein
MGAGEEVANTRFASVGRDPVTLRYLANWSDEENRHEDGGEFEAVDDAIEWARARAPLVLVTLGFANPVHSQRANGMNQGKTLKQTHCQHGRRHGSYSRTCWRIGTCRRSI